MFRPLLQRFKKPERRGAAAVEMAIVLPLFFMIILAIIEFGRAMMVSNLVINAAREGVRYAIIDGSTNAQAEKMIKDFMKDAASVNPKKVNVKIVITPDPGNPNPGNQLSAALTRDLITVTVSVPFNEVQYFTGNFLQGKNLVGMSAMRHE